MLLLVLFYWLVFSYRVIVCCEKDWEMLFYLVNFQGILLIKRKKGGWYWDQVVGFVIMFDLECMFSILIISEIVFFYYFIIFMQEKYECFKSQIFVLDYYVS